jgi:hypothetical protein
MIIFIGRAWNIYVTQIKDIEPLHVVIWTSNISHRQLALFPTLVYFCGLSLQRQNREASHHRARGPPGGG